MKQIVNSILILFLLGVGSVSAQDEQKQKTKKELKREAYEAKKQTLVRLLDARDFVLQADRVSSPLSRLQNVSNKFNYVKVAGDSIFVQFAVNGLRGENGFGGDTYLGKISQWSTKDKGEGKPLVTMIGFLTPSKRDFVSVYLTIKGGDVEARLVDNNRIITLMGDASSIADAEIEVLPNRSYH